MEANVYPYYYGTGSNSLYVVLQYTDLNYAVAGPANNEEEETFNGITGNYQCWGVYDTTGTGVFINGSGQVVDGNGNSLTGDGDLCSNPFETPATGTQVETNSVLTVDIGFGGTYPTGTCP